MDRDKIKNLGYTMGSIFAFVVSICLMAIVIAATAKIVLWIL